MSDQWCAPQLQLIYNYTLAEFATCCWNNKVGKKSRIAFDPCLALTHKVWQKSWGRRRHTGFITFFCKGKFSLMVVIKVSTEGGDDFFLEWTSFSPVVKVSILYENGHVGNALSKAYAMFFYFTKCIWINWLLLQLS